MFLLTDRKILAGNRTETMTSVEAQHTLPVTTEGLIRGRDAQGNPILGRIGGMSRARELMEAKKKREEAERATKPSPRELKRRRKRGQ